MTPPSTDIVWLLPIGSAGFQQEPPPTPPGGNGRLASVEVRRDKSQKLSVADGNGADHTPTAADGKHGRRNEGGRHALANHDANPFEREATGEGLKAVPVDPVAVPQTNSICSSQLAADGYSLSVEKRDCIFPDCLIRTDFGPACEHSCPWEKSERAAAEAATGNGGGRDAVALAVFSDVEPFPPDFLCG